MLAATPFGLGASLARILLETRAASHSVHLGLLIGLVAPLSLLLVPSSELWERAHFSITAYVGLAAVLLAWHQAQGRERSVRGWIAGGFLTWAALHAAKNAEYVVPLPFPPDALLVGVVLAAAGAYRADLIGRMPWRAQLAVYLDALVVTAAMTAALLVLLPGAAFTDAHVTSALLHGIVFIGIVAATAVLDLTVLAELKPRGAYALLAGIAVVAIGFTARAVGDLASEAQMTAGLAISVGGLIVAYGAATWTDSVDDRPRYASLARRLREVLPLAAMVLTPFLLLGTVPAREEATVVLVHGLSAFALVGVAIRQTLLLQERDGVLHRLAEARSAAERRTQQIAGLEEVGRLLTAAGPTDHVLNRVLDVIHERFGYGHVALFLADGPALRLGAQRGYSSIPKMLDGASGITGRVMRSRTAELVRDVSADADYLMADPDMQSEICAPLIDDDGSFLGVIDVESGPDEPLDETDLAAVVAVADQLAGAIALSVRRDRLLVERNFTSTLLDTVAAVIVVSDSRGRVVRFNPACAEVSGYSLEELRRHESFSFLVPPEEASALEQTMREVRQGGTPRNFDNEWIRKDGERRRISWTNRPIVGPNGEVEYVLATGIDITDRKALEDQLAHRALHDHLTGLPNRALLRDRLDQALRRRRRSPSARIGVLLLDLDGFKLINDTLGHEAGDEVLVRVATCLGGAVRQQDTAARLGGDEFAVVLDGVTGHSETMVIADRIRQAIASLDLVVRGIPVKVDASIGAAVSAPGARNAGDLLRQADMAMYAAKASGGGGCSAFEPAMHRTMVERRDIERLLSKAVDGDELLLHYQPIVDLGTDRLAGVEALLRWHHPERGLIGPAEFLRIAEGNGLIVPIGRRVLREACRQMAHWIASAGSAAPAWMSVNTSPRQFENEGLFDDIAAALADAGLSPDRLMVEITESVMFEMTDVTMSTLARLRELGVRIAIDDFGSGYSSLNYLRRLPIDMIKIDRAFVAGIDTEPRQAAFVSALLSLAETLSLQTLAEGIETAAQCASLRQLGCALGQGYHLGSPVAGDQLLRTEAPAAGVL
ncbi:MAG TPA: EAL domain-containing protein [Candidatus Limnocylindrales bacterium]|nr:EAL domain-containing protein [Candidatus Limnocylindrales bacterium]